MASIMDMVQQHLGDNGVTQLTQHLGVDQGTAQAAIAAALPMLVNAAQNQMSQSGGTPVGGLAGAAGGLLGNLFGGDHSQAAQQVSQQSGLDIHQAEKALLFLAPIVLAKFMNRQPAAAGAPAGAAAPAGTAGQPATPQAADAQASGLGSVLGAVEKMFHRGS